MPPATVEQARDEAADRAAIAAEETMLVLPPDLHAAQVAGHSDGGAATAARLKGELRGLYNTTITGQERARHLTGPKHHGYRGETGRDCGIGGRCRATTHVPPPRARPSNRRRNGTCRVTAPAERRAPP